MPAPDPAEAMRHCDEGFALLESGRFSDAEARLLQARALAPDHPKVHFRMALLYVDTGRPDAALAALDRSLELDPDDARAHNNRGSALQLLGREAEAERAFRRALDLAPDLAQPYLNLGHLLEKRGDAFEAVALYERAIARGLDPASFGHHVAAALGKPANRAPDTWVRTTFDNFAPIFDARLQALEYDAPQRLASMLHAHVAGPVDILDLGCGTGQCGVALARISRHLTGVDLSEKMLAQARTHGVYDALRVSEIGAWLADAPAAHFDVVVAADVFIYIGALEQVFRDVARTLRPDGWFAFSVEETAAADYALQRSGRFAQSQAYIARLAGASFTIVAAAPAVIRKESGVPLAGRLYLLRNTP